MWKPELSSCGHKKPIDHHDETPEFDAEKGRPHVSLAPWCSPPDDARKPTLPGKPSSERSKWAIDRKDQARASEALKQTGGPSGTAWRNLNGQEALTQRDGGTGNEDEKRIRHQEGREHGCLVSRRICHYHHRLGSLGSRATWESEERVIQHRVDLNAFHLDLPDELPPNPALGQER
jgi:hypothetical protein